MKKGGKLEGWKVEKLGDVVDFQRGLTYAKKDEVDYSSNIVLRATNVDVNTNTLDFSELKYINEKIVVPKERKVKKGSLIICTASGSKSHLGKVALIDDDYDYAFGGFMGQITPRQILDSKFLFYSLTSEAYKKYIDELSDGVNINNLRFDDLANFEIPIPPLPEQQRIVSVLDEAFASIAQAKSNAEQNLVNARELFEAVIDETFKQQNQNLHTQPLADLCEDSRLITYGVVKLGDHIHDGVPCLRTSNVRWLSIETNDMKRISPSLSKQYSRTILKGGEVLVNVRGTLGGVAVVPQEMAGWNMSREVAIVPVDKKKIEPQFVSYFIASGISQKWFGGVTKGAAYVGINIEDLRLLPVVVPPLAEQRAIVGRLEALSAETGRLEEIYQQKVESLEELKKSILQKAFQGEL